MLGEAPPIEESQEEKRGVTEATASFLRATKYYGGTAPILKEDSVVSISQSQEDLPLVISLKDGKKAKLIYPEGITNEDWDKVIRIIQAMKE